VSTPVAGSLAVTPLYTVQATDAVVSWDDAGATWRNVAPWLTAPPSGGPYVKTAGDTMTGALTVNNGATVANPLLVQNSAGAATIRVENTAPASTGNFASIDLADWTTTQARSVALLRAGLTNTTDATRTGQLLINLATNGALATAATLTPTALTLAASPAAADNSTNVATTAWVTAKGYATTAQLAGYLPLTGGTLTGRLTISLGDASSPHLVIGGTTKGARLFTNASGTTLEGVDNTGFASYQPFSVGGSVLYLTNSGATAVTIAGGIMSLAGNNLYFAGVTSGAGPRMYGDTTNIAWQLGTGNGAFAWYKNDGTQLMLLSGTTANLTHGGQYHYFGNSTGTINGTGGPFIYADTGNTAIKLGSGNANVLFQSYSGSNFAHIASSGTYYSNSVAVAWANSSYVIVYDSAANQGLLLGGGADKTNYYRNTGHRFQGIAASPEMAWITGQGLVVYPSGDIGGQTDRAFFSSTVWRFKQVSGDEASAGRIDYRVANSGALSIIGAGTASGNRTVQIYDNLFVGAITATSITSTGASAGYTFGDRGTSGYTWVLYGTDPGGGWGPSAVLYRVGNRFAWNDTLFGSMQNNLFQCGAAGFAWSNCTSYAFTNASDRRDKTDIEGLPDCLALVRAINPQRYRWAKPARHDRGRQHWGFVAQEVGAAMASAGHDFGGHVVSRDRHGLAYHELTAVLWKAVQELSEQVEELQHGR